MQQIPRNMITTNPAKGKCNKSQQRGLQQILPEATNPAGAANPIIFIAPNPATYTGSCNIQLHQMMQNAPTTSNAIPTNPAVFHRSKTLELFGGWVLWHWASQIVAFPCPDQLHPLKSKAKLHVWAGCSSHGSSPVEEATGDGPRSTNPDP